MNKKILLQAPIKTRSGYGDHARDIAYAILKEGRYDLEIYPTNWGNTPWNGLDESTDRGSLISSVINETPDIRFNKPDILIQLTIPNEFQPIGKYNIGMTAGIETDLCKPEWVEGANRMDMLIGVSNHSVRVLEESKYDKQDKTTKSIVGKVELTDSLRREVLFEGVDTEVYKKTSSIDLSIKDALKDIKEDFCFLFVGHWLKGALGQDRKDVGMLIRCFVEAFKQKPSRTRPALILKTSGSSFSFMDRSQIRDNVDTILKDIPNPPSVYIIHGHLTESEMNSLYNHHKVKAMVSFTKGEGFGRPLLEFTTTGKPVIASNWSGPVDFLNPEMSVLLPGELTPLDSSVLNDWFMKEAKWFTVNYPYAIRTLQAVHKNYDSYKKMAGDQKKHTLDNFTFDKMSSKLHQILDSIDVEKNITFTLPKLKI